MLQRCSTRRFRAAALLIRLSGLLLPVTGCTNSVGPVGPPGPAVVYVVDSGWHTDIALPVGEMAAPLARLELAYPAARYLDFGFGERRYFMASDPTVGDALGALFPSRSVVLMTALAVPPPVAFGNSRVVAVHVSNAGAAAIQAAIWGDLAKSAAGEPIALGSGPFAGSEFFAARGTYDVFSTCNTWTVAMLRAGGLPVSATGIVFSNQVMDQARMIAARQDALRRQRG